MVFTSASDLTLLAGRICGLLAVGGTLRMEAGAVFQGLALVGGDLHLEAGSRVEGMARIGGSATLSESAILQVQGCPVLRALAAIPALRKPLLLPGSSPFPLY